MPLWRHLWNTADLDSICSEEPTLGSFGRPPGTVHSIVVCLRSHPSRLVGVACVRSKGCMVAMGPFGVLGLVATLLDTCHYGTQLLAPFTDQRFSWDTIAIIDAFTIPLLIALELGSSRRPYHGRRPGHATHDLRCICLVQDEEPARLQGAFCLAPRN